MSDVTGMTLEVHPGTLKRAEIQLLGVIARKLQDVAGRYANWLAAVAEFEETRRNLAEVAVPVEPQLPKLNCVRWSDAELCAALVASFIGLKAAHGLPGAQRLLTLSHDALLAWNQSRFGRQQTKKD